MTNSEREATRAVELERVLSPPTCRLGHSAVQVRPTYRYAVAVARQKDGGGSGLYA